MKKYSSVISNACYKARLVTSELTCQMFNLGSYVGQAILARMRSLSMMVTHQSSGGEEITPLPRIPLKCSHRHSDGGSNKGIVLITKCYYRDQMFLLKHRFHWKSVGGWSKI